MSSYGRQLTRALLEHDYGIHWNLKEGHLIPAVTNRANYIHWIKDLLLLSASAGQMTCEQAYIFGLHVSCNPMEDNLPLPRKYTFYCYDV